MTDILWADPSKDITYTFVKIFAHPFISLANEMAMVRCKITQSDRMFSTID